MSKRPMRKAVASRDLFAKLDDGPKSQGKPGRQPARGRSSSRAEDGYTAADIEVLEGLEPVRRRPGMYIGGTDEKAMHHLFAEVLDNAMDEAVSGHADHIGVAFEEDGSLTVTDNGRGIPGRSASEIQEEVGARNHHDYAACGREIQLQGL